MRQFFPNEHIQTKTIAEQVLSKQLNYTSRFQTFKTKGLPQLIVRQAFSFFKNQKTIFVVIMGISNLHQRIFDIHPLSVFLVLTRFFDSKRRTQNSKPYAWFIANS